MSKLVERLRHEASLRAHYGDPILEEAADEIERLLAQLPEELRNTVLEELAQWYTEKGFYMDEDDIAPAIRALKSGDMNSGEPPQREKINAEASRPDPRGERLDAVAQAVAAPIKLLRECLKALPNASDESGMPLYEDLQLSIEDYLRSKPQSNASK